MEICAKRGGGGGWSFAIFKINNTRLDACQFLFPHAGKGRIVAFKKYMFGGGWKHRNKYNMVSRCQTSTIAFVVQCYSVMMPSVINHQFNKANLTTYYLDIQVHAALDFIPVCKQV